MKRFLLIPVFVILAGCGVKKPFEGRLDPYPPGQVNFSSQMLQDSVVRTTPIATRDEVGSILYVTVPLRSTINEPLYIDYRINFIDRNGQRITDNGWQTKMLTPNVPDSIMVKSGNARAADFQLDIRPAK